MKKLFLLVAAAVAVAANAQSLVEFSHDGLASDAATAVAAGTVLGENEDICVKTVFDDDMKLVNLKHNGFGSFACGTIATTDTMGIQGANNPKDTDGANCATACTVPTQGSIIEVNAKQDGYIYVFHKGSSNKQYMVEEGDNTGVTPIGYHQDLLTKDANGYFGTAGEYKLISYTIEGNNEFNQITDGRKIFYAEDYAKEEGDTTIFKADYKQNGPAVIVVKVYAGYKYWVHATGSKISANAVLFTADPTVQVVVENEDPEVGTKVLYDGTYAVTGGETAVENVASQKAVKVLKNGQVVIVKDGVEYNVLGAAL